MSPVYGTAESLRREYKQGLNPVRVLGSIVWNDYGAYAQTAPYDSNPTRTAFTTFAWADSEIQHMGWGTD